MAGIGNLYRIQRLSLPFLFCGFRSVICGFTSRATLVRQRYEAYGSRHLIGILVFLISLSYRILFRVHLYASFCLSTKLAFLNRTNAYDYQYLWKVFRNSQLSNIGWKKFPFWCLQNLNQTIFFLSFYHLSQDFSFSILMEKYDL